MRTVLALSLVIGAVSAADARKPAIRDRDLDFMDFNDAPEPCARGKTWDVVRKCLEKTNKLTMIHQTDVVKVVAMEDKKNKSNFKRVVMYAKRDKDFVRTPLSAVSSESNEVLSVTTDFKTPHGDAVRIDVGQTARSSFGIASGTVTRGILRRTFTTVCIPSNWSCVTLMTRCEAIAAGRTYYMFHGEPTWHPTLGLRMRGSLGATGGVCKPSTSQVLDD